jgi:hypothetical protein
MLFYLVFLFSEVPAIFEGCLFNKFKFRFTISLDIESVHGEVYAGHGSRNKMKSSCNCFSYSRMQ